MLRPAFEFQCFYQCVSSAGSAREEISVKCLFEGFNDAAFVKVEPSLLLHKRRCNPIVHVAEFYHNKRRNKFEEIDGKCPSRRHNNHKLTQKLRSRCHSFWGSMVLRHAPIPRKGSGKQQQQQQQHVTVVKPTHINKIFLLKTNQILGRDTYQINKCMLL